MQKILLVIDMQNDFVTGALGTPQAAAVVEGIAQRVAQYRREGHAVIFTMDTHRAGDDEGSRLTQEAARIPRHCIQGTPGWALVPALEQLEGLRIEKPTFLCLSLAERIRRDYGQEVELLLCGVCTDICVVSNALALRAEFPHSRIEVDAALCAGTTPERHAAALAVMGSCLVDII